MSDEDDDGDEEAGNGEEHSAQIVLANRAESVESKEVKKDPKRVQNYLQKKLLRLRQPPDTDQVLRDPMYKAQMIELLCRTKYEKSGYNVVEVIQRDDKYAYSEFFNKAAQTQIKSMEDAVKEMILKTDLMQPDIDTSTPTSTKLSIKHSK